MANHASALKRHRQSEKRRARNTAVKTRLRHAVRDVRHAVAAKDVAVATSTFKSAERLLTKAASKGVVHQNAVARTISRLARAVHAIGPAPAQ